MSKIHMLSALPHDQLQKLVQKGAKAFPDLTLGTISGTLDEVVEFARTTPLDIYEVILSRGGMALALREVLPIPVISLQFSNDEILKALKDAADTCRPFAVAGHKTVVEPARSLWQAMGGGDTVVFAPLQEHELTEGIQALKDQGVELVVGDVGAVRNAQAIGLEAISFQSTAASILAALQQVDRYAQDTWQLRRELSLARKVSDLSQSALLVLNEQWIPVFTNEKARQPEFGSLLRQIHAEYSNASIPFRSSRQIHKVGSRYYSYIVDQARSTRHSYILISATPLVDTLQESPAIRVESGRQSELPTPPRTRSHYLRQVAEVCTQLRGRNGAVLIWGDPGTEQAELARYLARSSLQAEAPLIFIECAALTSQDWQNDVDSQLLSRYSSGCTVLFSGIHALPTALQARIAMALERDTVLRRNYLMLFTCVGNPHLMAAEGSIHPALYRVLSRWAIRIPALDQRREEIPELAIRYCHHYSEGQGTAAPSLTPQALISLQQFHWFLNMDLFNTVMDRLITQAPEGGAISEAAVQAVLEEVSRAADAPPAAPPAPRGALREIEREVIRQVLEEEGMNQSRAAKRLGISRSTLWRKLGGQGNPTS